MAALSSISWGGVFFLSQIMQELINEDSQRQVKDVNGNIYYAQQILNSGNAGLLNATFYYNPDAKTITYVSQVNPGGNSVNPQTGIANNPINGWVNTLGNTPGTGPALAVPPPQPDIQWQPLPSPGTNQGTQGFSGALTPFVSGPSYYPLNNPMVSVPLYTVYS
jgi:hypothetical protein